NAPRVVFVVLEVLAASQGLPARLEPAGVIFRGVAQGDNPGTQPVLVHNPGNAAFRFDARLTGDPLIWSLQLPANPTVEPGESARIDVSVNAAGRQPGAYRSALVVQTESGQPLIAADLVLLIAPAGSVPPS